MLNQVPVRQSSQAGPRWEKKKRISDEKWTSSTPQGPLWETLWYLFLFGTPWNLKIGVWRRICFDIGVGMKL